MVKTHTFPRVAEFPIGGEYSRLDCDYYLIILGKNLKEHILNSSNSSEK